jgi:hypothetical protein
VDSIELLRRYRPDLTPHQPGLDAVAAELGDLPLALHLAGSYMRTYRAEVSLDDYLIELRRSDVVQHASLLGAGLDDSHRPSPQRLGASFRDQGDPAAAGPLFERALAIRERVLGQSHPDTVATRRPRGAGRREWRARDGRMIGRRRARYADPITPSFYSRRPPTIGVVMGIR